MSEIQFTGYPADASDEDKAAIEADTQAAIDALEAAQSSDENT